MLKRKLILSSLSLLCCLSFSSIANAQVDGYLIKNNDNIIQYNIDDLLESMDKNDNLYKQFQNQSKENGIYAYHDDSGKIVSTQEIINAYLDESEGFNLNNFIKKDTTKSLDVKDVKNAKDTINTPTNPEKPSDNVSIDDLKKKIKTPEELIEYFNKTEKFNTLKTPAGTFKFTNSVKVNKEPENLISPAFDISITTDWKDVFPYEVATCKNCTKEQAKEIAQLLKNYQKQLADITLALFPNKKVVGQFYTENKEQVNNYPYHEKYVYFYTWGTYDVPHKNFYCDSKLKEFTWYEELDNLRFTDRRFNLYN
ncbi:hypothetical protein [Clostridium brassicae]|uniref:Uncharacterized protein n=1 Tax=Clostridium brassicae TaxID=2999072 RepID=A0ABT4DAP2_9CLOT|nr:hypothetical protein [Clostridium brassicae]MCY6958281.1 hypothetical protein [Clostridium brassicae]